METIMKEAGSCGRFQTVQISCICLVRFVCIWGGFMMTFGNYNPGWRCRTHTLTSPTGNRTTPSSHRQQIPSPHNDSTTKTTHIINYTLFDDRSNQRTYFTNTDVIGNLSNDVIANEYNCKCDVIESCVDGIEFNPESSTIISEFGLVCDRAWIATVIILVASAGFVLGPAVAGQVGERYGRKVGLYTCALVSTLSSGAAIFSPNWQTYAFFTFLMATGALGALISSYVFATEFLDSKWRGFTASRPIMSSSLCTQTILMLILKNWKHLHMATFVLLSVSCCGCLIVHESPRWLFVHSNREKGEKIIQKIAKRNGEKPVEMETIETFVQSLEKGDNQENRSYSYRDLFRSKQHILLTLKTSIHFTLSALIYRALLFGLKSVPGNFYDNAIVSSFIQAGVLFTAGPISNVIGRRRAGFVFSFLGSISCFIIVVSLFLAEGYTRETIIKIWAYIARAVAQASIAANLLLTAEAFPTAIRSVALGFNSTVASTGAAMCAFVIPKDDDRDSFAVCYSVMAVCGLANIVVFWSLPETNKVNLKDSIVNHKKPEVTIVASPDVQEI